MSRFKTFDDFLRYLDRKDIDPDELKDDEGYWAISEKDYSTDMIADYHHEALENYLKKNFDKSWSEDYESCFSSSMDLEEEFNILKSIDGKKISLEETYDSIYDLETLMRYSRGTYFGDMTAKVKDMIAKNQKSKVGMKSLKDYLQDDDKKETALGYPDFEELLKSIK